MDNKALYVHKNGTYLSNGTAVGVPTSGSSRTGSLIEGLAGSRDDYVPDGEFMFPVVMDISNSGVAKLEVNFGNGYFRTTTMYQKELMHQVSVNLSMMFQQITQPYQLKD